MKDFIELLLKPILFVFRKATNLAMREVIRNINRNTNAEIFRLEIELKKIKKYITKNVQAEEAEYSSLYNDRFYYCQSYSSFVSATHVLKPLLSRLSINSIADFGCGIGTWLYAAKQFGVKRVKGVDGDYINRELLLINEDEFCPHNLEMPLTLDGKFDLAISLECAEHLHESAAEVFVDSICAASDVVLFSAAHVGQGGTGHINCQPLSYWEQKFLARGYLRLDIRPYFRKNIDIETWYRENMSLYVKVEHAERIRNLLRDVVR